MNTSTAPIFYHPYPLEEQVIKLNIDESKHAFRVLRLRIGDGVFVINGMGQMAEGMVQCGTEKALKVELNRILSKKQQDHKISIALAPTKNMCRIEWFAEKATEIGIDQIAFFHSKYSERRKVNIERVRKKVVSALKQSGNLFMPKVEDVQNLDEVIATNDMDCKYIAHLNEKEGIPLIKAATPKKSYLILVGSEGGFSEEELKKAFYNGFKRVTLGRYRLRTETAALAACHILNLIQEL